MVLKNGIVMNEYFKLQLCDIKVQNDKIIEIGENLSEDDVVFDMKGKYILPGFVDSHIHGANGTRVDDDVFDYEAMLGFEATQGVTSLAVTTASSEYSKIIEKFNIINKLPKFPQGSKIMGIHAEGPFLNIKVKGAMNSKNVIPVDIEKFDEMYNAGKGLLKIITVAPEIDGAIELIKHADAKGVTVSMGHTDATFEEASLAIEAGAKSMTHTFNASRPINHREPGVLVASLNDDRVDCEVICDYVHVHPEVIKMIYKLKGADRISIISDSVTAAGIKVDKFYVGGIARYVKDGVVRLEDGTIAGSARTMADGVKNLITSGIPIEDVSKMASFNPARRLKVENQIGSIAVGKMADFAVLDNSYNVEATFINGTLVYQR